MDVFGVEVGMLTNTLILTGGGVPWTNETLQCVTWINRDSLVYLKDDFLMEADAELCGTQYNIVYHNLCFQS